jgi:Condensation domain
MPIAPTRLSRTPTGSPLGPGTSGISALLPQQAEWFTHYDGARNWFFVPSPFVFRIEADIPTAVIGDVVNGVLAQYDSFTCRYEFDDRTGWQQRFAAAPPPRCEYLEQAEPPTGEEWVPDTLRTLLTQDSRAIDIEAGRLARVAVVAGAEPAVNYLLLICHHLALDASSWRLFAADLHQALTEHRLPPRRPPLHGTVKAFHRLAGSPVVTRESAYWLSLNLDSAALPAADHDNVPDRVRDVQILQCVVGQSGTAGLIRSAVRNGLRPGELLTLAGAAAALDVFGNDVIAVDNTIRGRDIAAVPGLRDVVGWLSTYAPFVLTRADLRSERTLMPYARSRMADQFGRGHAFSLLKYLSPDPEIRTALAARTKPAITCNYVGTTDGVSSEVAVSLVNFTGFDRLDVDSTPSHPLFVTAELNQRQMTIQLAFSARRYESSMAQSFLDAIRAVLLRWAQL